MTDAEYYAAFHAMIISFVVPPDPTGEGMVRRIADYGKRGPTEFAVAKRALREICDSDGGVWDAHQMAHWLGIEQVEWSDAVGFADHG